MHGFSVIPNGELLCTWVLGGVLSYKLCERDYQCDSCPLDIAMRHLYATASCLPTPQKSVDLGEFCHYPSHVWVKPLSGDRALIGIDQFLSELVSGIDGVLLPRIGLKLSHSAWLAKFVVDEEIITLITPMGGTVLNTNFRVTARPEILITSPYIDGWLIEMRVPDIKSELEFSIPHDQIHDWLSGQRQRLDSKIGLDIGAQNGLDVLAQDGFLRFDRLKGSLGSKGYARLIRSFIEGY
jgi:glycine cleavage system H lipoate-binding protein